MKQQLQRKTIVKTVVEIKKQRERQLQAITSDIPDWRLKQINKYLRNAERGRLPMFNDGADVTRQITQAQVAKFQVCKKCQAKPVVFFPWKKGKVGVCADDWVKLSETVIGWSGT